jgi:hypothetical protein
MKEIDCYAQKHSGRAAGSSFVERRMCGGSAIKRQESKLMLYLKYGVWYREVTPSHFGKRISDLGSRRKLECWSLYILECGFGIIITGVTNANTLCLLNSLFFSFSSCSSWFASDYTFMISGRWR